MSRKLITVIAAFVALNGFAVGAALQWPGNPGSNGSQAFAAGGKFDPVSASQPIGPTRTYIPAYLTMIDFERVFGGPNALPPREYVPVVLTAAVDFEHVFGSVTVVRRDNTPTNRERLRNAGWKRVLEAS
jgi:hypothetical protein